jgi:hypothetical protein
MEHGYNVEKNGSSLSIYVDARHAAAFHIKLNSANYLQVHQWEDAANDGEGDYGRAVYSLRSYSDVVEFCNVLMASARLRARRPEFE